jgi:PIN domain
VVVSIVYVFPDTNLFIQCIALEGIDWSDWQEYDELHLIVSRPVQREIDHQKNRGNDRIGRRARKTASLLREIIVDGLGYKVIRESNPCVKLFIKPTVRPSRELSEILDYQERDDQLVGTVHAFAAAHPDLDVRLLTHDTGLMATAPLVGVEAVPIPETWVQPAEDSKEQKTIKALEEENRRLRNTEPKFDIVCIDGQNRSVDDLKYEFRYHQALTEEELVGLVERIRIHCPPATDFGPRKAMERKPHGQAYRMSAVREVFVPATEEAIEEYRSQIYPNWLQKCENKLRTIHSVLNRRNVRPTFCFLARNVGTRPGQDVLIGMEASGGIKIMPLARLSENDIDSTKDEFEIVRNESTELPRPPEPPHGKWNLDIGKIGIGGLLSPLGAFQRSIYSFDEQVLGRPNLDMPALGQVIGKTDPNAFYYRPSRPASPSVSFELECEQWRHGMGSEQFAGRLYFDAAKDEISGTIECSIHAANLSGVLRKRIPVRSRILRVSTFEQAERVVDRLIESVKGEPSTS